MTISATSSGESDVGPEMAYKSAIFPLSWPFFFQILIAHFDLWNNSQEKILVSKIVKIIHEQLSEDNYQQEWVFRVNIFTRNIAPLGKET